jgi:hypothetical protein
VRRKYEEVGYNGELPADLPRQLTVSQRVTARHPVTRQLHDGDILTVAANCYRCAAASCLPTAGFFVSRRPCCMLSMA